MARSFVFFSPRAQLLFILRIAEQELNNLLLAAPSYEHYVNLGVFVRYWFQDDRLKHIEVLQSVVDMRLNEVFVHIIHQFLHLHCTFLAVIEVFLSSLAALFAELGALRRRPIRHLLHIRANIIFHFLVGELEAFWIAIPYLIHEVVLPNLWVIFLIL